MGKTVEFSNLAQEQNELSLFLNKKPKTKVQKELLKVLNHYTGRLNEATFAEIIDLFKTQYNKDLFIRNMGYQKPGYHSDNSSIWILYLKLGNDILYAGVRVYFGENSEILSNKQFEYYYWKNKHNSK